LARTLGRTSPGVVRITSEAVPRPESRQEPVIPFGTAVTTSVGRSTHDRTTVEGRDAARNPRGQDAADRRAGDGGATSAAPLETLELRRALAELGDRAGRPTPATVAELPPERDPRDPAERRPGERQREVEQRRRWPSRTVVPPGPGQAGARGCACDRPTESCEGQRDGRPQEAFPGARRGEVHQRPDGSTKLHVPSGGTSAGAMSA
jgi:hypothetical protein